jgi:hypothetical protein
MDNLDDRAPGAPGGEDARKGRGARLAIIILAAVVLITAVMVWLFATGYNRSNNLDANANRPPAAAVVDVNQGGQQPKDAVLLIAGRDSVMLAVDEESLGALMNALSTRSGVEGLIESGKVFTAPNGTKVRVLETNSTRVKVRILEGPDVMKEGWVYERWLQ